MVSGSRFRFGYGLGLLVVQFWFRKGYWLFSLGLGRVLC
jgi:hypothetical protein